MKKYKTYQYTKDIPSVLPESLLKQQSSLQYLVKYFGALKFSFSFVMFGEQVDKLL